MDLKRTAGKGRGRKPATLPDELLDIAHLEWWLAQLAKVGQPGHPPHGLTVLGFSPEEKALLDYVKQAIFEEELGLDEVHFDAVGNLYGVYHGKRANLPAVVLGGHIDTVGGGGWYDGRLNIVYAMALIRALKIAKRRLDRNIIIVVFRCEEAEEFGVGTIGSRVVTGKWDQHELLRQKNRQGVTIAQRLEAEGRDPFLAHMARNVAIRDQWAWYFELHVDQGNTLKKTGNALAVSPRIAAADRYRTTIFGEGGHSGAVPNGDRKNIVLAQAKCVVEFEAVNQALWSTGSQHRASIPRIEVLPGGDTQIPEQVVIRWEVRHVEDRAKETIGQRVTAAFARIGRESGLRIVTEATTGLKPVGCDPELIELGLEVAAGLEIGVERLDSFAWHDAGNVRAAGVPTFLGLGRGLYSHTAREQMERDDIMDGARFTAAMVLRVDESLEVE